MASVHFQFKKRQWLLLLWSLFMFSKQSFQQSPQVPCFFIFGDSYFDSGNNNLLVTRLKSNYLPYGIDFPEGTTGRFTNGRTIADILTELTGFKEFIKPYALTDGKEILRGVNYASGGSGILNETARHLGDLISLGQQLNQHGIVVDRLARVLGNKSVAMSYLNRCLYAVSSGTNDYINNYFLPQLYNSSRLYSPQQFSDALVQKYIEHLKILYGYGARKIALLGLPQIGCMPLLVNMLGTNGSVCVDQANDAAQLFNAKLNETVRQLSQTMIDARFLYINAHSIQGDVTSSPGFKVKNSPCCATIQGALCDPLLKPCPRRSEYVYWDGIHGTEDVYVGIAARAYAAQSSIDVYPYDICTLIAQ